MTASTSENSVNHAFQNLQIIDQGGDEPYVKYSVESKKSTSELSLQQTIYPYKTNFEKNNEIFETTILELNKKIRCVMERIMLQDKFVKDGQLRGKKNLVQKLSLLKRKKQIFEMFLIRRRASHQKIYGQVSFSPKTV